MNTFERTLAAMFASAFIKKAAEIKAQCQPGEVGKAKDGSPVLGLQPADVVRLRTANAFEQVAQELVNSPTDSTQRTAPTGRGYSRGRKAPPEPAKEPIGFLPLPTEKPPQPALKSGNAQSQHSIARQMGYTGDACGRCGQLTLKWAGHCLVCDSCGETGGCG